MFLHEERFFSHNVCRHVLTLVVLRRGKAVNTVAGCLFFFDPQISSFNECEEKDAVLGQSSVYVF